MKIKINKKQWREIGKKAGWKVEAGGWGRFGDELTDVLSVPVIKNKTKSVGEIVKIIQGSPEYSKFVKDLGMTETELIDFVGDMLVLFGRF